jgi:TRAP-type mannitol/chloroaromatic compound transport system permease small subunit
LNAALIMLGGGYTLLEKGHVAVDILVTSIPPRRRAILDLVTSFFFFFGFVILLWYGWDVAWTSWKAREAMPTVWAPPYYPIKMLVPIGAFLMLIQGVAKLIQDFQRVRERREGDPS